MSNANLDDEVASRLLNCQMGLDGSGSGLPWDGNGYKTLELYHLLLIISPESAFPVGTRTRAQLSTIFCLISLLLPHSPVLLSKTPFNIMSPNSTATPQSVDEQADPIAMYSRSLYEYTLLLWEESRRAVEDVGLGDPADALDASQLSLGEKEERS